MKLSNATAEPLSPAQLDAYAALVHSRVQQISTSQHQSAFGKLQSRCIPGENNSALFLVKEAPAINELGYIPEIGTCACLSHRVLAGAVECSFKPFSSITNFYEATTKWDSFRHKAYYSLTATGYQDVPCNCVGSVLQLPLKFNQASYGDILRNEKHQHFVVKEVIPTPTHYELIVEPFNPGVE